MSNGNYCPVCHHTPLDCASDVEELKYIGKTLISFATLTGMLMGLGRVAQIIYYDCTKYPKIETYLWCPNCRNFILTCPICNFDLPVGMRVPITPEKYTCPHCKNDYIFTSHPDPEIDHSQYL